MSAVESPKSNPRRRSRISVVSQHQERSSHVTRKVSSISIAVTDQIRKKSTVFKERIMS